MIAKTTNAGVNWNVTCSLNTYSNYNKIRFFNQTTGIFTSWDNNLYRTTNGGDNWVKVQSTNVKDIFGVYILNSNTGFISGSMSTNEKRVYKTTDAGASWFQVFGGSGNFTGYYSIKFINQITGYCVGYGILKTTNSGNNWYQINSPTTTFCTDIEIITENTMYVSTYEVVYKSTNGGYSWGPLNIPTNERIEFIKFFDANTGIIAGDNSIILKTTNGGGNFVSNISINEIIPDNYYLGQNYPNPFNPISNIKYKISKSSNVRITVFDVRGKEVEILVNEKHSPGEYLVSFDGSALNSGVYFYKMVTDGFTETKKMVMIK